MNAAWEWLLWTVIIIGILFWIFSGLSSLSSYPEESFWEIWEKNGKGLGNDLLVCTCCCKISVIVRIIDALNEGKFSNPYYYKRTGG